MCTVLYVSDFWSFCVPALSMCPWCTWTKCGMRNNLSSFTIGGCVRGTVNHSQSHSLLSSFKCQALPVSAGWGSCGEFSSEESKCCLRCAGLHNINEYKRENISYCGSTKVSGLNTSRLVFNYMILYTSRLYRGCKISQCVTGFSLITLVSSNSPKPV